MTLSGILLKEGIAMEVNCNFCQQLIESVENQGKVTLCNLCTELIQKLGNDAITSLNGLISAHVSGPVDAAILAKMQAEFNTQSSLLDQWIQRVLAPAKQ